MGVNQRTRERILTEGVLSNQRLGALQECATLALIILSHKFLVLT